MSESSVAAIEAKLGYRLSAAYRRFLAAASADDRRDLPIGLYSFGGIVKANLRVRRFPDRFPVAGLVGGNPIGPFWPDNWLVIADNGGGDYYFVFRDEAEPGVWVWSHESHEIHQSAESFEAAIEDVRWHRQEYPLSYPSPAAPEPVSHPAFADLV